MIHGFKMSDLTKRLTDRPNILANMEKLVRDEYANGNIPADTKLALVNTIDTQGIKIVGVVALKPIELKSWRETVLDVKIKAIFEHDWDGNNTGAIQTVIAIR